jgi:hypothetical protein
MRVSHNQVPDELACLPHYTRVSAVGKHGVNAVVKELLSRTERVTVLGMAQQHGRKQSQSLHALELPRQARHAEAAASQARAWEAITSVHEVVGVCNFEQQETGACSRLVCNCTFTLQRRCV